MSTHTHAVPNDPSSVPRSFFPCVESIRGQSLQLGHPETLPLFPGCDLVRVNPLHHDTFEVFNGVVWTVEMAGDESSGVSLNVRTMLGETSPEAVLCFPDILGIPARVAEKKVHHVGGFACEAPSHGEVFFHSVAPECGRLHQMHVACDALVSVTLGTPRFPVYLRRGEARRHQ